MFHQRTIGIERKLDTIGKKLKGSFRKRKNKMGWVSGWGRVLGKKSRQRAGGRFRQGWVIGL